jgi:hypothetical protein
VTAPIIVRGRPTDLELAALAAALVALRTAAAEAGADEPPARGAQGWRSRHLQLRTRPGPGPGAWRASVRH